MSFEIVITRSDGARCFFPAKADAFADERGLELVRLIRDAFAECDLIVKHDGGPSRLSGIRLDTARLDYEMARRGISARRLSEVSGLPEATVSRARHGRPVLPATFRKLTDGLLAVPLVDGLDLLHTKPKKEDVATRPSTQVIDTTGEAAALWHRLVDSDAT